MEGEIALEGLVDALITQFPSSMKMESGCEGQNRKKTKADSVKETLMPSVAVRLYINLCTWPFAVTSARVKDRHLAKTLQAATTRIKL